MATTSSNVADDHMASEPQKTVLCSTCNLWFSDVLNFVRHYAQHEIHNEVQCLLCQESFRSKTLIVDHYRNFHNIKLKVTAASLPDGIALDQRAHVDHSYFRADRGEQVEIAGDLRNGQGGAVEDGDGEIDQRIINVDGEEEKTRVNREEEPLLFGGNGEAHLVEEEVTEIIEENKTAAITGEVILFEEVEKMDKIQEEETLTSSLDDEVDVYVGEKKMELVEEGEKITDDDAEPATHITSMAVLQNNGEPLLKGSAEIENEEVTEFEDAEGVVLGEDCNDDYKQEVDGSVCVGGEDDLVSNVGPQCHREGDEGEQNSEEEEKREEAMEEDRTTKDIIEDSREKRLSPFDGETLDSIPSEHNDDSNTFMEQINLDTGDPFETSFSGSGQGQHAEENTEEIVYEYQEGDFRFISGLRHRQIHIANSDMITDIGMQVFICLHCDFIDSEVGLVNHMQKAHQDVLDLEGTLLEYSREVPEGRGFPENITGEEVIRLSEYHRRNLEQKHLSNRGGKRTSRCSITQEKPKLICPDSQETPKKKKRYVENRMPCLCPECGKMLCRKSALRTHILGVHSRSRNHLCEVCGKAFRASYHLSQHRKSHRTKSFSCDLCDFTSDVRMEIFDHQQLHPNKFILCHVCGTVLKSKTALTRHMLVHSESRPFACTVEGCTWRFTSEALCKGHIESHSTPGEFICLECKRRFRKRHHIRRHLKTLHGKVSNSEADKFVAVDTKEVPSTEQYDQIPVTQLSKQHIVITTDIHGTPIFCDQSDSELVFDSKTSSLLQVTVKHSDNI